MSQLEKRLKDVVRAYVQDAIDVQSQNIKYLTALHKGAPKVYNFLNENHNLIMKLYENYQKRDYALNKIEEIMLINAAKGYREVIGGLEVIIEELKNDFNIINERGNDVIVVMHLLSSSAVIYMAVLNEQINEEIFKGIINKLIQDIRNLLYVISGGVPLAEPIIKEIVDVQKLYAETGKYLYYLPFDALKDFQEKFY